MTGTTITRDQQENLHRNILRILEEIGVRVENAALLDRLAAIGGRVHAAESVARFPAGVVEAFLQSVPKIDWTTRRPNLMVRASFYAGEYLDARTGALGPLTEQNVREYLTVARALPNVTGTFLTGCPWCGRAEDEPLYERLYAWKYGSEHSGILYPLESRERLLTLYEAYAQLRKKPVSELFCGGVFMMSPLRFGAEEAAQYLWWQGRGFPIEVSHMTTAGLTAPVTTAGVVAVNVAEEIAIALLRKACYGESRLNFCTMISSVDMRTMVRPYGCPELVSANRVVADIARFYGVACFGHSGVTDAKRPGCEAGAQKAMNALGTLLGGADAMIDAGLLSSDEIYSPVQMILDNELAGALKHLLRPVACDDDAIGFEAIREAGPGGLFTGLPHTLERYRDELWQPQVWTRLLRDAWRTAGSKQDIDLARDRFEAIMARPPEIEKLTPDEEQILRKVIAGK